MANSLTRSFVIRSLMMGTLFAVATGSLFACTPPNATDTSATEPVPASSASEAGTSVTSSSAIGSSASKSSAIAGTVLATGQFTGAGDHIVTGGVEVVEVEGNYFIQLADDFSLDNAPDPKVGLGRDGYDPETKAGELISLTGASTYQVPAGIDVEAYNEVHIWCERFSVPLGIATLVVAQ